jgi:hypothetical protein
MEENLLNELENFTSIKCLDDVTNNNNCFNDDEQVYFKIKYKFCNYIFLYLG